MASPPAGSPPGHVGLTLPRQRPPMLALPTKSRRPSLAPSTGSSHPLRQTSFPPPEIPSQAGDSSPNVFSPGDLGSVDEFSDDADIQSAISGPNADEAFSKKRKRGEKRPKGRQGTRASSIRAGSASIVNGDDGRSTKRGTTAGAASIITGEGDEDDDDVDDDPAGASANVGIVDAAELEKENQNRYLFREAVNPVNQSRYDSFNRAKLRREDVRRLVNQTLSQSVPQNVITVVQAYTKMFAGILIEGAREVQAEYLAARPTLADGETTNRAYKRLRVMQADDESDESEDEEEVNGDDKEEDQGGKSGDDPPMKKEPGSEDEMSIDKIQVPDSQPVPGSEMQPNGKPKKKRKNELEEFDDLGHVQPGAWGLAKYIEEPDRGPLLPDHLRESLRRYRQSRVGGSVGFTGISLARPEVVAPRMGGKRLFR